MKKLLKKTLKFIFEFFGIDKRIKNTEDFSQSILNSFQTGEDDKIQKLIHVYSKFDLMNKKYLNVRKILFIPFTIIIFLIIFIAIQQCQMTSYKIQYKQQYQLLYSINKSVFIENRKKIAKAWLTRLALTYNPDFDIETLSQIVEIVFNTGEMIYGIPTEEWGILISLESMWKPYATSPAGAKGLMQLMPVTAMLMANEMKTPFYGDETLFNPIENLKIGMRYYNFLNKQYSDKITSITMYNFGETKAINWYRDKNIPNDKLDYYRKFFKLKESLERKLGEPIFIKGLKDTFNKDYSFQINTNL